MLEFGIGVAVFGVTLTVLCSPQRDAILWRIPGFVHRVIRWLIGYEMAQRRVWAVGRPGYIAQYEWRRTGR